MGNQARAQIGSLSAGVVVASILVAVGRASLALPFLGGVAWGLANLLIIERVIGHLRPDRPRNLRALGLTFLLKFPAMYLGAFLLLRGRARATILAAAGGLTLVLVLMLLRSIAWLMRDSAKAATGSVQRG